MKGYMVQRSQGAWTLVFDLGADPATGKRKQKWITVRGTRKDADRELSRLLNEINTGAFVEPAKLTVAEFLDRWLTTYAEPNVGGKTIERYRSIINLHLKPALGLLPLPRLTPLHIQEHYAQAMRGGRKDGRPGGLSGQSVLHHHRVLREALGMAVRWQLLARNPADAVEPPTVRTREVPVIDERQTAWLLEVSKGTRIYIPILLAVSLGLRRGEILAARWSDLNIGAAAMCIGRSLEETKARGLQFKEAKGKRTRTVAVPLLLAEALGTHRIEQAELKHAFACDYLDGDLICCQPDGAIWRPSAFTSAYRDLLRRRKLAGPNFHALRHSHASHLLRNGVDIREVSARLGHAKAGFTLSTYVHLLPGQDEEAARRIDVVLRKAIEETRKGLVN